EGVAGDRRLEETVATATGVLLESAGEGVVGICVVAALEVGRQLVGGIRLPAGVGVGQPGLPPVGPRHPPQQVVERPVLHHQEHDVIERRTRARGRQWSRRRCPRNPPRLGRAECNSTRGEAEELSPVDGLHAGYLRQRLSDSSPASGRLLSSSCCRSTSCPTSCCRSTSFPTSCCRSRSCPTSCCRSTSCPTSCCRPRCRRTRRRPTSCGPSRRRHSTSCPTSYGRSTSRLTSCCRPRRCWTTSGRRTARRRPSSRR